MKTFLLSGLGLSLLLAVTAGASACSSTSSGSTPCNIDPFSCAAGKTCWPIDTAANFSCVTSGSGQKGDACQNAPGTATCGDGLACLQQTQAGGTCVAYCDPNSTAHGCGTGETCTLAGITGTSTTFHVCHGSSTPVDAGDNDAGGGNDAGDTDAAQETDAASE